MAVTSLIHYKPHSLPLKVTAVTHEPGLPDGQSYAVILPLGLCGNRSGFLCFLLYLPFPEQRIGACVFPRRPEWLPLAEI
jgi:hypothetical protein